MENGWIKVEDQKPPIGKWVLVANENWVEVGKYEPDEDYNPDEPREDQILHPDWQDVITGWISPTHWQPLPPPPTQVKQKTIQDGKE